jgi:Spy/CpxP family protein refolding chaperone
MKTSIRLALLGCALSFAATGVSVAQSQSSAPTDDSSSMQAPHKAPDPQHQTARLTRLLQLTPEQAAQIEPILQNRDQQISQLRSDGSGGGHGKMRAIMQDTNSQLQAILTDNQKQKYQQIMQQAMQRRQDRKNNPVIGSDAGDNGE